MDGSFDRVLQRYQLLDNNRRPIARAHLYLAGSLSMSTATGSAGTTEEQAVAGPPYVRDKIVVVTGANRGIGKAIVDVLLERGARKVYAAVRNVEVAKQVFQESERLVLLYLDLSKPETIEQAAWSANDVEIVINNAGVLSKTGPLEADAVDNLKSEMEINVYGLMHMAKAFTPLLQKNAKGGIFVQINSVASMRCALPEVATYSASKAAAYSITQALRQLLPQTRFLSVHPGPIATEMIIKASPELAKIATPPVNVAKEIVDAIGDESIVFHVFPDYKSKLLGQSFSEFGTDVIEGGRIY